MNRNDNQMAMHELYGCYYSVCLLQWVSEGESCATQERNSPENSIIFQ